MEKRLLGHTVYRTEYHVVWGTKYRRPVLNPMRRKYLVNLFRNILTTMPGCEVVEYNIQPDHVHMVIIIPPKYAVSDVIGRIKGMSSNRLLKRFSKLANVYWRGNSVWSPGFYISTVGVSESVILSYVRNQ